MKICIVMLLTGFTLSLSSCDPKIKSQEDQEVRQGSKDSLNNPQEGKGEGPVPDEVIK